MVESDARGAWPLGAARMQRSGLTPLGWEGGPRVTAKQVLSVLPWFKSLSVRLVARLFRQSAVFVCPTGADSA